MVILFPFREPDFCIDVCWPSNFRTSCSDIPTLSILVFCINVVISFSLIFMKKFSGIPFWFSGETFPVKCLSKSIHSFPFCNLCGKKTSGHKDKNANSMIVTENIRILHLVEVRIIWRSIIFPSGLEYCYYTAVFFLLQVARNPVISTFFHSNIFRCTNGIYYNSGSHSPDRSAAS